MDELAPGLYESLVTEGLKAQLDDLVDRVPVSQRPLRVAEASDRIALHLSRQIAAALDDVSDDERVEIGSRLGQGDRRSHQGVRTRPRQPRL